MAHTARIGLLGGTFNPIHRGHVAAALAAREALDLHRVVLLPAHVPPHRAMQPRASGYHRFAMTAIAAQEADGLEASDIELRATGPSYTAHTLAAFHRTGVTASQLFFIIGADAFAEIATWFDYPHILDAAHFVVVSRPGHRHDEVLTRSPTVAARVVDLRGHEQPAEAIPEGTTVIFLATTTADVSSTGVRRRLDAGQPIDDLVPPAVARHIARHHLYQPRTSGNPLA